MARNGSGVYSKVNTFTAGTTITASDHNENWDDLASEITNSVAADGQTTMTGPLKASSGTVAAPGIAFASDLDSGLYRIGSNNIGVAVNGSLVVDVATTGMAVTGDVSASGALKQGGFSLLPVGVIMPYAGTSAPTGYLLCDGASLVRADYPALFSAIGTTYGAADGTHFNVPDLKGRVPAGKEASASRLTSTYFGGDSTALGATGGSESHTLTTAQLASHSHTNTLNDPGHAHTVPVNVSFGASGAGAGIAGAVSSQSSSTNTTGVTITNASAGSGQAHNNTQPTIILNYIIFAGV